MMKEKINHSKILVNRPVEPATRLIIPVFLALLILISTASTADALGVTPGRRTLDFEPGLEQTISFTIVNDEQTQGSSQEVAGNSEKNR